jgi:hypothetical protein
MIQCTPFCTLPSTPLSRCAHCCHGHGTPDARRLPRRRQRRVDTSCGSAGTTACDASRCTAPRRVQGKALPRRRDSQRRCRGVAAAMARPTTTTQARKERRRRRACPRSFGERGMAARLVGGQGAPWAETAFKVLGGRVCCGFRFPCTDVYFGSTPGAKKFRKEIPTGFKTRYSKRRDWRRGSDGSRLQLRLCIARIPLARRTS